MTNALLQKFTAQLGNDYLNMIDDLRSYIIDNKTEQSEFVVIPMEAGTGKSIQTDIIIGEHIRRGGGRSFLLVKRFNADVEESVTRINGCVGVQLIPAAIGITSENWAKHKDQMGGLLEYQVITITHERYKRLCMDSHIMNYFSSARHTIIIDEGLEMSIYTFSSSDYNYAMDIFPREMHKTIIDVCQGLFNEIERCKSLQRGNCIIKCKPQPINEWVLLQFEREVEANLDNIQSNKESGRKFAYMISVLYSNDSFYSNDRITGYDRNFKRIGLSNNIILDANGNIDNQYHYDSNIRVDKQTPIVDHSNWTLRHVKFNTSASNISKSKNYFDEICKLIAEYKSNESKTLVITQNKHELALKSKLAEYELSDVDVAHFGAIIGKNDWREHNQVWIVANPLIPMEVYPIRWAIATGQDIPEDFIQMVYRDKKFRFVNDDYESMRRGCVIGELYQGIKRVNRDNNQSAEVFIVHSDEDVIRDLEHCMRNIKFGEIIELDNVTTKGKSTKQTIGKRIADYLVAHPGKNPKHEICEALGIKPNHLSKYLKDAHIRRLCDAGILHISHAHIEVIPVNA